MTAKKTPTRTRRSENSDGSAKITRRRQPKAVDAAKPAYQSDSSQAQHPSHEDVAFAAYTRYLSRQGAPGSDFDDWLAAERELMARHGSASPREQTD